MDILESDTILAHFPFSSIQKVCEKQLLDQIESISIDNAINSRA